MAVVSKHDAIVSMSASSSSFPFGILLFGIVLFSFFCGQSPLLRYIAFVFSSSFPPSLSPSLSLYPTPTKNPRRSFFCPLPSAA